MPRVRETCSCGASIDYSGSMTLSAVTEWRQGHRHETRPAARGICGARQGGISTTRDQPAICTLLAGHPGWHGDGQGMSWGTPRFEGQA